MKLLRDDDKSEHSDSNDLIQVQTLISYKVGMKLASETRG